MSTNVKIWSVWCLFGNYVFHGLQHFIDYLFVCVIDREIELIKTIGAKSRQ